MIQFLHWLLWMEHPLNSAPFWITIAGVLPPLFALAGSAVAYVVKLYQDAAERRRNYFYQLLDRLDSDLAIATKMAAVYELRRFPEHKDFIIRFCDMGPDIVSGSTAGALKAEMLATRDAMLALDLK